jgi:hypothetical protein
MRRTLVLGAAVVLGLSISTPMRGQENRHVFVSLAAGSGIQPRDLQLSDVTVVEDDQECITLKIDPVTAPIKLIVLIDNGTYDTHPDGGRLEQGWSMNVNEMRNGLRGLFMALPAGVEMSLQTMAPQVRWVAKQTRDRSQVFASIDRVSPGGGPAQFFDGLADAGNRMQMDENAFPVIVMVTTDGSTGSVRDQQLDKLRKQLAGRAATVHFVLLMVGAQPAGLEDPSGAGNSLGREFGLVAGALQTQVGQSLTKTTGGRFESLGSSNRLTSLLPEIGQQIARSDVRQRNSVRVTYEAADPKSRPKRISVRARDGVSLAGMSLDGHMP